jgi:ZIP family zinc transporter
MEAGSATAPRRARRPGWLLGLVPLLILAVAIGLFVAFDAPGLDRNGAPIEELAIERTVLRPGEIELHVRNDGPDPVRVAQVMVNDGFAAFTQSRAELGRLEGSTIAVSYPWIEGQSYEAVLVTSTGATVAHEIEAAAQTPSADLGFYGLMALIGLYVGVIPVAIGMLWLPWLRTVDPRWTRFLLAFTIGLLAFLGVEALLEGTELAGQAPQSFGGAALVWAGAAGAYLALAAVDGWLRGRRSSGDAADSPIDPDGVSGLSGGPGVIDDGSAAVVSPRVVEGHQRAVLGHVRAGGAAGGYRAAFLVALGIGLHNLGEGLAIGSAYAIGSLALGAALVAGFALHNATEGLAIVAPVARGGVRLSRLAGLGFLAGAPAVLGAWIGASAYDPTTAALMFGIGAGAIAQVIVQIAPSVRDQAGRLLHPLAAGGGLVGLGVMYTTGLLVSV